MSKIGAVILAAGMSKRMGQPKLLLPLKGKPLFRYAVDAAVGSELKPIVVVGGSHTEEFHKYTKDLPNVEVVATPFYQEGMASSLKRGVRSIADRTEGMLVFLADQPYVPVHVIKELIRVYELHRSMGVRIIRPQYAGELGHPILFDASLYKFFLEIDGDEGGRSIIKRFPKRMKVVSFSHSFWGRDVDTPEDYLKMNEFFSMIRTDECN
ncbi:nucleotidyltransferase family protein [Brevibacillus sp. NRS-1366]|uniref:nucleotidyltransferase family protein n=1 Tax=Brevibacillus sp. NRS-1366 TaxID=3233899 RepID=UPI003D1E96CD